MPALDSGKPLFRSGSNVANGNQAMLPAEVQLAWRCRATTPTWRMGMLVWEAASKEQVVKWQEEEDRTATAVKQAPANPR
jgi:hypothetical protein